MALLSPTFLFSVVVVIYLSSFLFFALLRIITGLSIQRLGYFSLRRLAYTLKDGLKIEIRGVGLNLHRPTFAQPTWLSIVISELVVTVDIRELEGKTNDDESDNESSKTNGNDALKNAKLRPKPPSLRRGKSGKKRSQMWKHLMKVKEQIKLIHRKLNWIRLVDVVATNSTINIVDVGNVQFGSFTMAVDTRRKMVDRARFFLHARPDKRREKQQAEWIITLRSVLFTAEGKESLEILDNATLNVHGFLYEALDGLRDTAIALKLGRVHIPYDDVQVCAERFKRCKRQRTMTISSERDSGSDVSVNNVIREIEEPGSTTNSELIQTVSDSKEFVSSILRGIKEVQFAVSFVGVSKKIDAVQPKGSPVLLNAAMKEVGIDLHRLDPKSAAHRMYFPSKDIAHEALAAALSISIGVDDGQGNPQRLLYVPMATTTVRTTLPSKTVELAAEVSAEDKNANILFANSVVTSPSVDLDPRHLPLLLAMMQRKPKPTNQQKEHRHMLISRLLPKANIKFSMHEPVVRIALPPVHKTADPDDFDLIISSISSISLDMESFHSAVEDLHYSLASTMRLQTHQLYYQTSSGSRFDLVQTESFDLKVQLSASPDVHVVATGSLQTFSIKMVRPEITDGLRQIVKHLRRNVEPDIRAKSKTPKHSNFLRAMPSWLLHFQIQADDFSMEVAGIDEEISEQTRGIALQLDSWSAEYRAQKLEGLQRRPSRRRASSRAMLSPDADLLKSLPTSPQKRKHFNHGDGRRIAIHVRGLESYIVESDDRWEIEPFVNMPRFEVAFQTLSDNAGPVFHIHAHVRTLLLQYSLYRHYSVGVAIMVLRKASMRTSLDLKDPLHSQKVPSLGLDASSGSDYLALPQSPDDLPFGTGWEPSFAPRELVAVDVKTGFVQIKADMPSDPPMMLQIYNLEAGRHRWTPPFLNSKLIRLYCEAPRMRRVWARIVSVKNGRVNYRESRRKLPNGSVQEEKSIDIDSEAIRIAVPHEVVFYQISDNFINVVKSIQQLHHRFKTGTNEYILEKGPEGPKNVPKVSLKSRSVLFELEDGGFEWKLGMIYRAGRVEQMQRLARDEAFKVKVKKIYEQEAQRDSSRYRHRSVLARGRTAHSNQSWTRSRSEDSRPRSLADDRNRGRAPRYDPDGGHSDISGSSRVSIEEARQKLHMHNAQSWKRRIDRHCTIARNGMKELRGLFWGPDQVPEDINDGENILEVPHRAALMSALITELHFTIDKPSFPMKDLPEFLHKVGKGMPRDMQYSLLVPMNVQIGMDEARVSLRDYPLPLLHVPGLKSNQSAKLPAFLMKTDFVIAEEYRGPQATRRMKVDIIPPRSLEPGVSKEGSFAIDVRRTIGPVKSFSDMSIDINTANPTRVTWGPSYQPAIQDMMMAIESFTKPQLDPSERVGFWDKIRLGFHSRVRIAWKGDGDVHLALKGSRDPYLITGNGAGFLLCFRNDVRWNVHADDDPKRFMTVESGEFAMAVPDYSQQVRETARRDNHDNEAFTPRHAHGRSGAEFKKVVMKLSGKVQWLAGLVFERAIEGGKRNFTFKPHYDVVLKAPHSAVPEDGLPYDAFRGFRSQHIHLSIAIRAPVDREWATSNKEVSRSYNTIHLSPRLFTHFFNWWTLFGGPLSLPVRQGSLWPGREKNSKKFGRHLATIKYNLLLAPLFLSHIYKHKDADDPAEDAVSATGVKVRFDSFMLDMHQRREEFNTRDQGRKTQTRTSSMKIHAAQLDLASADIRAVSASIKGAPAELMKRGSIHQAEDDFLDLSRFTIPDNDFSWIDMDDFVELDWLLPGEPNPETQILPLAFAPRLTYFRQTDIDGMIDGDPDRSSPFGDEPTHYCIMSQDDDPRRVQAHLIRERLDQLKGQVEKHKQNLGELEVKLVREGDHDPLVRSEYETLSKHGNVLEGKKAFLQSMHQQMLPDSPRDSQASSNGSPRHKSEESIELEDGNLNLPTTAEFASDFKNRFVVHNMQLKWNNLLRNIILRYSHQVSQRRGFVYYLSRPAVKFILDIVEEQTKKSSGNTNPAAEASPSVGTQSASPDPASAKQRTVPNDIEDRIQQIIQDGRRFVNADDTKEDGGNPPNVPMTDLSGGISEDFSPQNSYHIRLIAPQIQLQSDKNKKHAVLVTAKGMELKIVEVLDKDRMSDNVSGLVQRRFLVGMDSTQFFVTHQKWFATRLVSMYSGSFYGTPKGSSWPPWVPMEVMFDFQTDPFGFRRVVQKTSASLRYDKYNTLRLKYNDEVNTGEGAKSTSQDSLDRMDNLWVEFPQARALCNSSQYYALYVIVLDLLMYSEPQEKTRSERLEKIMLASDFSDLRGAPEMVTRLQERIRQLEDIKGHFQVHSKSLDEKGWEDRMLLEKDLTACEDELFFIMKAITTSQRKYDSTQSNGLLKWSISAGDIVWHLIRDNNEPLVELQLKDVEYDRTDNSDGSHINLIRVGKILGLNLLEDAIYPEMIVPYIEPGQEHFDMTGQPMIRVYWYMLEAIAGIPVMDHFEVNLFPMKVQLEREVGKKLFEYIFPGMDGERFSTAGKNDSPLMVKQRLPNEADESDFEDDSVSSSVVRIADLDTTNENSARAGSLELRLRPTLNSDTDTLPAKGKGLNVQHQQGHAFSLFRGAGGGPRSTTKKPSYESLRSQLEPRPGVGRSATGLSSRNAPSVNSDTKKSRFMLNKKSTASDKPSDDLTKMITRASNYMSFAYIKMPSVVLCLSYKGKGDRNIEDVHDFVFRLPQIEYRNKTWSNLDLALALKGRVIKALISHTGAIIGNKFSKHRPNTAQQSKLRELATSSSLLQQQHAADSRENSGDDSSSLFGTSPVDFSRSPPRSLHDSASSFAVPIGRSASRSSSIASAGGASSHKTSNTSGTGSGGGGGGGSSLQPVPSFLMMTTPATPDSPVKPKPLPGAREGLGLGIGRSNTTRSAGSDRPGSSASSIGHLNSNGGEGSIQEKRKSFIGGGSGFFKDKLTALKRRKSTTPEHDGSTPTLTARESPSPNANGNANGNGHGTEEQEDEVGDLDASVSGRGVVKEPRIRMG